MKKTLLILLAILTFNTGFSQCPPAGDVQLIDQAAVDAFGVAYPACTTIDGDLILGNDAFSATDIADLSPLANITTINRGLDVRSTQITDGLSVFSNNTTINTRISLYGNFELTSLDGLKGVTALSGLLYIYWNTKLTDLTGLDNIASVGDYVEIQFNYDLVNFNGLDNLTTIGGYFWVGENTGQTSFSGLSMLNSITGLVNITNNDALTSFAGLESLATVGGSFYILGNDNAGLTDFTGFNGLTTVGTSFTIENNSNITSLNGFDLMSSIGTTFDVSTNAELTSLNGIEALTTISANGGTSGFQIDANSKLIDISGMVNVDHTNISILTIRNNTLLSNCEISNVCTYLDIPGSSIISGNALGCASAVEVNAACAALSVSDYLLKNTISIYPNPTFEQINITVKNNLNIESLSLFSLDGRLISEQKYELQSMDVSDIATGIYLLKINTNEGVVTSRIAKQ